MKPSKKTYIVAATFALQDELNEILYECMYNGCVVYQATCEAEAGACVGYPHFVIVNENYDYRYAEPEECLEIMRVKRRRK